MGTAAVMNEIIPIAHKYLNMVQVSNKMGAEQVVTALNEMIQDFPDWCVEDFRYFFREFSKGRFNAKLWRLDIATIYEGARNYEAERTTARERIIEKRKAELNMKQEDDFKKADTGEADKVIDAFIAGINKLNKAKRDIDKIIGDEELRQRRANYEARLIDYFDLHGIAFTKENIEKYRLENPFK